MPTIRVVNKHWSRAPYSDRRIYIGRGSALGNPFTHKQGTKADVIVATREAAIDAYRTWLKAKIAAGDSHVCRDLNIIASACLTGNGEVELVCYCKPAACHGDVIKEVILETLVNLP